MTDSYINIFYNQLDNKILTKIRYKLVKIYLFIKLRLNIVYKSMVYKEYRVWLFKRLTDKNWYKEKLVQLGIIK